MSLTHSDAPNRRHLWKDSPWWPAVVLILAMMTNSMRDMPQFAFFLIYLQEQLGLAPATISGIVAGAQLAGGLTALVSGAITARLGSKWVLVGGLVLAGLSALVFQSGGVWLVVLLWCIGGAGAALVTIGGSSYLTRLNARGTLGILAAVYALSMTAGGAIGNPIAGVLIEQRGFSAFGWAAMAAAGAIVLAVAALMPYLHDRATEPAPLLSFRSSGLSTMRQPVVRLLMGMRCLPTVFYGMMSVLIPLLLNDLSGSKVTVAAYGTTTLIVASAAQLLAGRAADRWGAHRPTLIAYAILILSGLGLAANAGTVWGLFLFGVVGIAAAWSLSTLMYIWVADGIARPEHPATFGLLHAVWSLSMISGSVLGGWIVRLGPGWPFLAGGLLNTGSFFLTVTYYRSLRRAAGSAAP